MDPVPAAIATLLNAIQAASQAPPAATPQAALQALIGQDLSMMLLGQAAGEGVSLSLPSGQVLTAQGQLPYPDGTALLIRILAGTGTDAPLRLQILQAAPPATPAILGPLVQGEADALTASLGQPGPPPGLADLAELFQLLGPNQTPSPNQTQAAVANLPAGSQAALMTLLDLPPGTSQAALASALDAWMAASPAPAAQRGQTPAQAVVTDLLQRFQASADQHPQVPAAQADGLVQWLRQLVSQADPRPAAGAGAPTPAQALQQQLSGHTGAPAELPATWEAWLKTSIKTLNDPAVAPGSAAFHAAQAKEGTAFYELPLPWAPQHPLQLWMETDRDPKDQGNAEPETQRVLLGLCFSNLGETRLGINRSPAGLQVRVWTEHPELLEASRNAVTSELEDLGSSVDLKIMALNPGPGGTIPSLRSQVAGATLEALG